MRLGACTFALWDLALRQTSTVRLGQRTPPQGRLATSDPMNHFSFLWCVPEKDSRDETETTTR